MKTITYHTYNFPLFFTNQIMDRISLPSVATRSNFSVHF